MYRSAGSGPVVVLIHGMAGSRETWRKAGDTGLLLLDVPAEYGGGGGDFRRAGVFLKGAPVVHRARGIDWLGTLHYGGQAGTRHGTLALASGALDDVSGTQKDDIAAELDRMSSTNDVELEMARLKGEIGAAPAPAQIEGSSGTSSGSAAQATPQQQPQGEQS